MSLWLNRETIKELRTLARSCTQGEIIERAIAAFVSNNGGNKA